MDGELSELPGARALCAIKSRDDFLTDVQSDERHEWECSGLGCCCIGLQCVVVGDCWQMLNQYLYKARDSPRKGHSSHRGQCGSSVLG